MRVTKTGNRVTVTRDPGDPRVSNESNFWYKLRNTLKKMGEDVIKKEMSKDGHMVSDHVFYVRTRKFGREGAWGIYDSSYALRDAAKEYNEKGQISLSLADLSE